MSGTDDAHVNRLGLAANRHHLAILQHPQQTGLQGQGHVADFIEEQRAAVGLLQLAAHAFLARAGEAAAAITEQLALDQAFRDGRAVEGDEVLAGALAGVVHGLGERLFAGAGFALNQQRYIALEHPQRLAKMFLQRRIPRQMPGRRAGSMALSSGATGTGTLRGCPRSTANKCRPSRVRNGQLALAWALARPNNSSSEQSKSPRPAGPANCREYAPRG